MEKIYFSGEDLKKSTFLGPTPAFGIRVLEDESQKWVFKHTFRVTARCSQRLSSRRALPQLPKGPWLLSGEGLVSVLFPDAHMQVYWPRCCPWHTCGPHLWGLLTWLPILSPLKRGRSLVKQLGLQAPPGQHSAQASAQLQRPEGNDMFFQVSKWTRD